MSKNRNRHRKETVFERRNIQLNDERNVDVEITWEFTRSYENDDADGNRGEWVNFWEIKEYNPVESLTKEETVLLDEAMDELECPENLPED